MDMKIKAKFLAFYLAQTAGCLLILILALWRGQDAGASAYRIAMVLVFLGVAGAGLGITLMSARRMTGAVQSLAEVARALAEGDLRFTSSVVSRDELGDMATHLNQAVFRLREDVGAITMLGERTASGSTQLSASAAQVVAATHQIHAGADEQRVEVAQASTSIESIAGTLQAIGAGITADVIQIEGMLRVGETGCQNVAASTRAMEELGESSAKVAAITTVITELANQTNLLSLNAAIEAAKAMEYGRGFTVVADEVRKLAERSSQAAQEIAHLIQDSAARVEAGARSVKTVRGGLEDLMRTIRTQADGARRALVAVQDQMGASAMARDRMATTLRITETSTAATRQLSASMTETAHTIDDLAGTADELRKLTLRFRMA
jgi:methyl-accepting chemotaxis protein